MTLSRISVVCRVSVPARVEMTIRRPPVPHFYGRGRCQPVEVHGRSLFVSDYDVRVVSSLSGTDSDLEAFSHNPADGSVAAMPCQTAAKTNYLNQRFLSY
jgi:hypothetical protein